MEYIMKNTTDHERAQMSHANVAGTPNDKMTLRDIYDEMWELDARCDKEETIGTAHEKDDNNMEGMTEDDWDRWDDNCTQMKNKRTGIYAQVTEEYCYNTNKPPQYQGKTKNQLDKMFKLMKIK